MPVPQLAEALYEAFSQRSTGWLRVLAEGRESQLLLEHGNLVGAEIRSGYRSLPQSLLQAGLLVAPKLDSLWAAGEGAGRRAIESLGLEWTQACEIQMLAQIERLSAKATRVNFEAGAVSCAFNPIPGERAVRAAWRRGDGGVDGWMFRCLEPQRCERWLLSEDERRFVRGFQSFKAPADASPAQIALLELLSRAGAVERARAAVPAQVSDETSWADLLDDDAPARPTRAHESTETAPSPDDEVQAMKVARARAEGELADEMNEALRRASSAPIEDWFFDNSVPRSSHREGGPAAGSKDVPIVEMTEEEVAAPAVGGAPPVPAQENNGRSASPEQAPGALDNGKTCAFEEEDVPDEPSDPEQAARARRQRLLRRAIENMGGLTTRLPEPTAAVDNLREPTPAPTPQASPSSDEMVLVATLEKKFHEIESGADHFAVLGVPRSATDDDVKAAFLELAKVFHPDRLPGSLKHLSAKMRAVFEAVREAYETLQSGPRRGSYQASIRVEKPPEKSSNPAEEALEAFKRGEARLRKRDYSGAEQEYHCAYLVDPKASYLAAEAWAVYMDPVRREQAARAKRMIAEAVKKDANCERAHYQLGVIARVEGDMDRAEKHFREAVRLDPKHPEANQELRLIQMRRKKGLIR
jgi:curved DNA-binding protein CbpA